MRDNNGSIQLPAVITLSRQKGPAHPVALELTTACKISSYIFKSHFSQCQKYMSSRGLPSETQAGPETTRQHLILISRILLNNDKQIDLGG